MGDGTGTSPKHSPGEVTELLNRWQEGDSEALGEMLPLLYDELRRLAGAALYRERLGHTLNPTGLVNELYLKLNASSPGGGIADRRHFLSVAARAMRQLLVDHARRYNRARRIHPSDVVPIDSVAEPSIFARTSEVMAVHEALESIESEHPRYARVVELHFFAGFTQAEAAEILGVSKVTVERDWALARALLKSRMVRSEGESAAP